MENLEGKPMCEISKSKQEKHENSCFFGLSIVKNLRIIGFRHVPMTFEFFDFAALRLKIRHFHKNQIFLSQNDRILKK